jgi:hypothetical protein
MGIAEDKDLCPVGNRPFKGIKVDLIGVPTGNEGRIDESPSVNDGVFDEVRVNGRLDQYPVPGACVRLKGNVQTDHQPGQKEEFFIPDRPVVKPLEPLRDN